MSNVYDNWEKMVGAVIRREQLWQMFHDRSPSVNSVSSDFSLDSQVLDVPFDLSSRAGTSLYQLPAVENSQKKEKSVKKLGSSVLEMRVKRRDAIQWMSYGLLPKSLREVIRRYDKYLLIRYLPKDLSKDIMRHLCLALLKRVAIFEKMDQKLLDAMCDRLKTVLYTEYSFIWRDGDPVVGMLFIMRGELQSVTTNGGRTDFSNFVFLKGGDFCGEELLEWALDPNSSSNLPISTRTVLAHSKAEVFALAADDLKFVISQFRDLYSSKQMRYILRYHSQKWRNWAANIIQVEWRHYCRKKLVRIKENGSLDALAKARMRHICLALLKRVPMFEKMDEKLLDAICDRLKPILHTDNSFIWRDGDPVDETDFSNYFYLKSGYFCGEELLEWALDPYSSSNLPISTRTVLALSKAKVFALAVDDLKFVVSQFRHLHSSKQIRYILRHYSQQWRNWATSIIQVEWRHYRRKKLVRIEENSSQDALVKARMQKSMSLILLQRPEEPDFTVEKNVAHGNPNHTSYIEDYIWAARVIQLAWQNYHRKKLIREEAIRLQDEYYTFRCILIDPRTHL